MRDHATARRQTRPDVRLDAQTGFHSFLSQQACAANKQRHITAVPSPHSEAGRSRLLNRTISNSFRVKVQIQELTLFCPLHSTDLFHFKQKM